MIYLSYSKQDLGLFSDLILDIKSELSTNNIEWTEDFNLLENQQINQILILHSLNYVQDPITIKQYQFIDSHFKDLDIIEINLDNTKSNLQIQGFPYIQHTKNKETITQIYNVLLKGYKADLLKTKITQNHTWKFEKNNQIMLNFGFKHNITEPVIYLIFQGQLASNPIVTNVQINNKDVGYEQYFDWIEMEQGRQKQGIKLYLNNSVFNANELSVWLDLKDNNIPGFYVWIEDLRQFESKQVDTTEFEKIYYNLEFKKILEM